MRHVWGIGEVQRKVKEKDHLEDPVLDGKIY
jgi:hypothetical protein